MLFDIFYTFELVYCVEAFKRNGLTPVCMFLLVGVLQPVVNPDSGRAPPVWKNFVASWTRGISGVWEQPTQGNRWSIHSAPKQWDLNKSKIASSLRYQSVPIFSLPLPWLSALPISLEGLSFRVCLTSEVYFKDITRVPVLPEALYIHLWMWNLMDEISYFQYSYLFKQNLQGWKVSILHVFTDLSLTLPAVNIW